MYQYVLKNNQIKSIAIFSIYLGLTGYHLGPMNSQLISEIFIIAVQMTVLTITVFVT